MKAIRVICRYIVGMVFVLSALTKAIDPVGVSLKVKEYLQAYAGADFGEFTLYLAVALCAIEFVCGAAILTCVKIRFFSLVALLLTAVFTVLTFCSAQFNLVADCGCFGDVIKLSAWGTFYKNVVLIILCIIVYCARKQYICYLGSALQWLLVIIFTALIIALCSHSYRNLPPVDYTDFAPGTDLIEASQGSAIKYKTECVYEKNGVREVFELENLPDSTWTFVETISTVLKGDERAASKTKFILRDADNNPVTEEVLEKKGVDIAFFSIYSPELPNGYLDKLKKEIDVNQICEAMVMREVPDSTGKDFDIICSAEDMEWGDIYIVSALTPEQTTKLLAPIASSIVEWENKSDNFHILYSDFKTLITLNRSNGGVTFVRDGKIERKLPASKIDL